MALTPTLHHHPSLGERLLHSLVAYLPERRINRPELSPEQRAHRIAMQQLGQERRTAAVGATAWGR